MDTKKKKLLKPAAHPQNSVQESFQGFTILLTASGHEHFRGWRAVRFCEALTYDLLPFQSQLGSSSKLIPTWCHRCQVWCRQAQLDRIKSHEKTLCSSLIRKSWNGKNYPAKFRLTGTKNLVGQSTCTTNPAKKNGRHIWQCLAGHQKNLWMLKLCQDDEILKNLQENCENVLPSCLLATLPSSLELVRGRTHHYRPALPPREDQTYYRWRFNGTVFIYDIYIYLFALHDIQSKYEYHSNKA